MGFMDDNGRCRHRCNGRLPPVVLSFVEVSVVVVMVAVVSYSPTAVSALLSTSMTSTSMKSKMSSADAISRRPRGTLGDAGVQPTKTTATSFFSSSSPRFSMMMQGQSYYSDEGESTTKRKSSSSSTVEERPSTSSARTVSEIRYAMLLSRQAAESSSSSSSSTTPPASAYESLRAARRAADAWLRVLPPLEDDDRENAGEGEVHQLPRDVEAIGRAMLGHALARCGRDSEAVDSYRRAISISISTGGSSLLREARMGCGRALQRLMRYREAREMFSSCCFGADLHLDLDLDPGMGDDPSGVMGHDDRDRGGTDTVAEDGDEEESSSRRIDFDLDANADALRSAVTCSLRLGDVEWARDALLRALDDHRRTERLSANEPAATTTTAGEGRPADEHNSDELRGDRSSRGEFAGLLGAVLWMDRRIDKIGPAPSRPAPSEPPPVREDDGPLPSLEDVIVLLEEASNATFSPLYSWLHHLAVRESSESSFVNVETEARRDEDVDGPKQKKKEPIPSSTAGSPLGRFLAAITGRGRRNTAADGGANGGGYDFDEEASDLYHYRATISALADVNHGPLDAPQLVRLDDKLNLHRMLTTSSKSSASSRYYPRTFVLPEDAEAFRRHVTSCEEEEDVGRMLRRRWMLKEPTGYGSHGNRVVTEGEVIADGCVVPSEEEESGDEAPILCQEIVHPPLLLDCGRKFSVRVYVLLLLFDSPPPDGGIRDGDRRNADAQVHVFVSREGLVKFAESPFRARVEGVDDDYDDDDDDAGMHMTNSARAGGDVVDGDPGRRRPQQRDLAYLRREFAERGWDYSEFRDDVHSIVRSVLVDGCCDFGGDSTSGAQVNAAEGGGRGLGLSRRHWMDGPVGWVIPHLHLSQFGLPKILGFDFLLDGGTQADAGDNAGLEMTTGGKRRGQRPRLWLIEINRFPGLRPRDYNGGEDDGKVKVAVVDGAWRLASKVVGVPPGVLGLVEGAPTPHPEGGRSAGGDVFEELRGAPPVVG